jgi:hypothetical protein
MSHSGPAQQSQGGVYVSDNTVETWHLVNSKNRLWGRGWYFCQIIVDPVNPDIAYFINTAPYLTTSLSFLQLLSAQTAFGQLNRGMSLAICDSALWAVSGVSGCGGMIEAATIHSNLQEDFPNAVVGRNQ